jgi:hypothetical protein
MISLTCFSRSVISERTAWRASYSLPILETSSSVSVRRSETMTPLKVWERVLSASRISLDAVSGVGSSGKSLGASSCGMAPSNSSATLSIVASFRTIRWLRVTGTSAVMVTSWSKRSLALDAMLQESLEYFYPLHMTTGLPRQPEETRSGQVSASAGTP